MNGYSVRTLAAAALDAIHAAFAHRTPPAVMTDSLQLSDVEYEEVMTFVGVRWQNVGFDAVARNADAVFWFSPQAFCYYLPGFMAAGLKEGRTDSNAYDALVGMLDRSPVPEHWDDFFAPRWTLLSAAELEAVAAWAAWLQAVEPGMAWGNTFDRVQETLSLLVARARPG